MNRLETARDADGAVHYCFQDGDVNQEKVWLERLLALLNFRRSDPRFRPGRYLSPPLPLSP